MDAGERCPTMKTAMPSASGSGSLRIAGNDSSAENTATDITTTVVSGLSAGDTAVLEPAFRYAYAVVTG